jgi:hypothetical protein
MDKKPLIGIVICIILTANISVVLGNTNEIPFVNVAGMGTNLAPNPSFEEGDNMPSGWTYDPDTNGIYHWDSNYAHSGEKSVGVLNLTNNTWPPRLMWITTDFIPVDCTANSYQFSAWFKFVETPLFLQCAIILVLEYDINYQLQGGSGASSSLNDTGWHQILAHTGYHNYTKYVKLTIGQEYVYGVEPNPLIEIRFDDIYFGYENEPPNKPTIIGDAKGRTRTSYNYTIQATDPDQDLIRYFIDWGDNSTLDSGFFESGEEVTVSHTWWTKGVYTIRVKAIDENFAESSWVSLTVTMPCSYTNPFLQFWMKLLERYPNAFPILRHLLGY